MVKADNFSGLHTNVLSHITSSLLSYIASSSALCSRLRRFFFQLSSWRFSIRLESSQTSPLFPPSYSLLLLFIPCLFPLLLFLCVPLLHFPCFSPSSTFIPLPFFPPFSSFSSSSPSSPRLTHLRNLRSNITYSMQSPYSTWKGHIIWLFGLITVCNFPLWHWSQLEFTCFWLFSDYISPSQGYMNCITYSHQCLARCQTTKELINICWMF